MNIVAAALAAEYVRQRNKLKGAAKRLAYAHAQVSLEEGLVHEYSADLDLIEVALRYHGGAVPAEDGEEPYVDEVKP